MFVQAQFFYPVISVYQSLGSTFPVKHGDIGIDKLLLVKRLCKIFLQSYPDSEYSINQVIGSGYVIEGVHRIIIERVASILIYSKIRLDEIFCGDVSYNIVLKREYLKNSSKCRCYSQMSFIRKYRDAVLILHVESFSVIIDCGKLIPRGQNISGTIT